MGAMLCFLKDFLDLLMAKYKLYEDHLWYSRLFLFIVLFLWSNLFIFKAQPYKTQHKVYFYTFLHKKRKNTKSIIYMYKDRDIGRNKREGTQIFIILLSILSFVFVGIEARFSLEYPNNISTTAYFHSHFLWRPWTLAVSITTSHIMGWMLKKNWIHHIHILLTTTVRCS